MIDYERAPDDVEAKLRELGEYFRVTEFHAYLPTSVDENGCSSTISRAWVSVFPLNEEEAKLPEARGVIVGFGSGEHFSTFCPESLYMRVFVPVNSARRLAARLVEYADQSEAANAACKPE